MLITQACTMATLCATLTDTDTSNIAVTNSNTAPDLNERSCLPAMHCREYVEEMTKANFRSTLLLLYLRMYYFYKEFRILIGQSSNK